MKHRRIERGRKKQRRGFWALGVFLLALCLSSKKAAAQSVAPHSDVPGLTYTIAGTVVNSVNGALLAEARISLADTKTRKSVAQQKTSEGGHFYFTGLPVGKFSLEGSKRGYISGSYEQHEQYSTAIVTGPELKTDELVLRLNPVALIGGHVRDENGEPVRHAQVTLFLEDHRGGITRVRRLLNAQSDDLGYFDFSGLIPGTYFVSVSAEPWYALHAPSTTANTNAGYSGVAPTVDAAYPSTYYSSATEAEGATPIVVKAGDHPEIEVQLNPVPALHILFRTEDNGGNGFPQPQLQKHVFDWEEPVQTASMVSVEAGVYELVGVPPGRYTVRTNLGKQGAMGQEPGSYTIVAVEDAWEMEWMQPGVLSRYAQHGQELTIRPLMRGTVHLPEPVEVQPK